MRTIFQKAGLPLRLAALAIILALAVPWQAPGVALGQTTGSVPIFLEPASAAVVKGDIVQLDIRVDASAQLVDAVQAYLDFEPAHLQVVDINGDPASSITPGPIFDPDTGSWEDVIQNTADNAAGRINFAGGKGTSGTAVQQDFVLATVRFKALLESSGTSVTFDTTDPFRTKAVFSDGLDTFEVTGTISGATLSITVPPTAADDAYTVDEDSTLNIDALSGVLANDTDPDSSSLTAALVSGVSNGSLTLNADGSFAYTPNAEFNGSDSFTYEASDGTSTSNTATVSLTVAPVNDPPAADDQAVTTFQETPVDITLTGSDLETLASDLTFAVATPPGNGSLTGTGANLTYTPNPGFNGSDSFTFTVTDRGDPDNCGTVGPSCAGPLTSAAATVSVTVVWNTPFTTTLQGRAAPPDPSWVMPFDVDLYTAGADPATTLPEASFTPTTDNNGAFVLNIDPGVYDIRAKGQHTLRVLLSSVDLTTAPVDPLDLGVQEEGDYNGDNVVDISDYSALLSAFGNLTTDLPAEQQTLDFNQDGVVDISDYSILLVNFGKAGVAPF